MEFFTIGVYNSTEDEFFTKLLENKIDTFCDIRQRRGVRGAKYAFVNSNRLQEKLSAIGVQYGYIQQLAPTTEIRELQKATDLEKGELKSERQVLGKTFVLNYKDKILNDFNWDTFFEQLERIGANKIVLFCVEENAEACHRSLVANALHEKFNYKISNL